MNVTLKCAALAPEIALCRRLAERKTTIPVYGFTRLDAAEGELRLVATDGEAALVTTVPATVHAPGSILVPTRTFADLVRNAAADEITLALQKSRVTVHCGAFTATLGTLAVEDFPEVPDAPAGGAVLIAPSLAKAFERVRGVIKTEGSTSSMHGAFLKIGPGAAEVVATDGYRIAKATLGAAEASPAFAGILPRKAVEDLGALLEASATGEAVDISRDERRATFVIGSRLYRCALLDYAFHNYGPFLDRAGGSSKLTADREAFLALLRRVGLVSSEKTISVSLSVTKSRLTATMQSAEIGTAVEELEVTLEGKPMAVYFDAKFLAAFLQTADPGPITLAWEPDSKAIALLTSGDAFVYALAPMVPPKAEAA